MWESYQQERRLCRSGDVPFGHKTGSVFSCRQSSKVAILSSFSNSSRRPARITSLPRPGHTLAKRCGWDGLSAKN